MPVEHESAGLREPRFPVCNAGADEEVCRCAGDGPSVRRGVDDRLGVARVHLIVGDAACGIMLGDEKMNGSEPINVVVDHGIATFDLVEPTTNLKSFRGDIRMRSRAHRLHGLRGRASQDHRLVRAASSGSRVGNFSSGAFAGKHIVIVSIHYWPEEMGIGPYATGTAEHLASEGARVTVLTTMPFYPHWKTNADYKGAFIQTDYHGGVEIRRIRQYIPGKQSAFRRALYELTFLGSLLRAPWTKRPDTVIGVIPSLSGGIAARVIATLTRAPYGLIVQDLSGQAAMQSGIAGGTRIARLTSAIEGGICRSARRVAVVAPAFRGPLEAMAVQPDAIQEIRNWSRVEPPHGDRTSTRSLLGWQDSEFIVLHAGNMGLKQGLEYLIDAASLFQVEHPNVQFVLMGDGNQRKALEQQAAGLKNVRFMDPLSDSAFMNALAAADVLLVHERASVMDMSLPSKLTSYFMASRPVLAAVNPIGSTAQEIERASAGLVIPAQDSGALLSACMTLQKDSALRHSLAENGFIYARDVLSMTNSTTSLNGFVQRLTTRKVGM